MTDPKLINNLLKRLNNLTNDVKLLIPELSGDCEKFNNILNEEYCKNNQLNLF